MLIRKIIALVFLVIIAVVSSAHAQTPPVGETSPPAYNIKVSFDSLNQQIEAQQKVQFTNNSNDELSVIHFHIYPNKIHTKAELKKLGFYQNMFKVNMMPYGYKKTDFKIDSITSQNKELSYSIEGPYKTILKVILPKPLKPFASVTINMEFSLKLPHAYGILGHFRGVNSAGFWYPILAVYKQGKWFDNPLGVNHQPYFSEAADYEVELTTEKEQIIAHSGKIIKLIEKPNGKITYHIKAGPVRDFTFASSKDYQVISKKVGQTTINLYYLLADQECASQGLEYAVNALEFYNKKFGLYPYPIFNIAETHIGWLGNEFSNMIFIDSRGFNLPDMLYRHLDFLISHEMAHQWWYLQVGSDQFRETWLDEAFASFASTLYLEDKYGKVDNYLVIPKWLKFLPNSSFSEARVQSYYAVAKNNTDEEILQPIDSFKRAQNIFTMPYGKGMNVLNMLQYLVGDEVFDQIMEQWLIRYKFKTANTEDFIKLSQELSGQSLRWFFDQWLKGTKKCDYAIVDVKQTKLKNSNLEGENWRFSFKIKRLGDIVMPVKIRVIDTLGQKRSLSWDGKAQKKEFAIIHPAKIVEAAVDPDLKLLDYRRQNNAWPKPIKVKLTPYYPILYEFPLLNPSDKYSVVAGTTLNVFNAGARISGRWVYDYMTYADTRFDFQHNVLKNAVGHIKEHAFNRSDTLAGAEIGYDKSLDSIERFGKVKFWLTKQLAPQIFSIDKILNDVTLYFERNREINLARLITNRSKVGLKYNIDSRILAWDPVAGAKFSFTAENAGHYLGADTDFVKLEAEARVYKSLWLASHVAAFRFGTGWSDGDVFGEELFKLGGRNDLRGYSDERFSGKNKAIASAEYRFPIISEQEESLLRNFLTFNRLNGAAFYDAGAVWDQDMDQAEIKSDIGLGLRFEITVLGFFEKTFNRLDFSVPTDDYKHIRVWFEITHAF